MSWRPWAVGVLLAASVAACGPEGSDKVADDTNGGGSTSATPPATPPSTTATSPIGDPPQERVRVRSVSIVRSGGLQPTIESAQFVEGEPPPKSYSSDDLAAVLATADSPALRNGSQPTIGSTCCDQYVYAVTIRWTDGVVKRFSAVQGAAQPPALARLLSLAAL